MVGVVLQYLEERKTQAVVVVPDQRRSWFPRLEEASVRTTPISEPGESHQFLKHQRGKEVSMFPYYLGMQAVEVDFRKGNKCTNIKRKKSNTRLVVSGFLSSTDVLQGTTGSQRALNGLRCVSRYNETRSETRLL